MSFQDNLAYLYSLQQFGIKLGLTNIRNICSSLANPHERIKTIHVGGTNGKGSTAAILSSVLHEAGYKTGLYTSPHLTNITERISIDNTPISQERFSLLIEYIRERIQGGVINPTFFEFITAIALQYFAEEEVDIAVMEVGMGGRLDATNIINPLVTIITNIEYDHTEHLGNTLKEIAVEKCGIIKENTPVVTSESKENVLSVIEDSSRKAGTLTYVYGRDFYAVPDKITTTGIEFFYYGNQYKGKGLLLKSPLAGRHQMFNLGAALYTIELLMQRGFEVTEGQLVRGIENTSWPGRLETLSLNPRVIVDGAHNHAGTIMLRQFINDVLKKGHENQRDRNVPPIHDTYADRRGFQDLGMDRQGFLTPPEGFSDEPGRIILIFGVLKDKDVNKMIDELISCASEIIITRPASERGLPVEDLTNIFKQHGIIPHITHNVSEALSLAYNIASPSDSIIITGSLYIAGEARDLIQKFNNERTY